MFQPPGRPPPGQPPDPFDAEPGPAGRRAGAGFAEGGVLDRLAPGPELAWYTQQAFDEGLAGLSDDELVGVLGAARRLSSRQAAAELRVVSELDRRRREAAGVISSRVGEQVSEELAAALTLTARSADELLALARELARIPMVLAALYAGTIDRAKAVVFAREVAGLSDIAAAAVGAALWRHASGLTTGQLRAELRSLVLFLDPAAAKRRAAKGRADSRVEMWPETSGNAALAGRELAAADAIVADQRITAVARALKDAGAQGTLDQLRAAVFVALLTGRDLGSLRPAVAVASPASGDASGSGIGPAGGASQARASGMPGTTGLAGLTGSVQLTMPLSAWLGQTDRAGEAAGYGPLDADACRDLAERLAANAGTRWSVTLTDDDGRAAAHARARHGPSTLSAGAARDRGGRAGPATVVWLASLAFDWLAGDGCDHQLQVKGYRPSARLADLVRVSQRTCGFPGCRRPARQCDLDHTVPYEQGGPTCLCNLAALCRRHHQVKQAPGWHVTQSRPGNLSWATPHGRTYRCEPDSYPV